VHEDAQIVLELRIAAQPHALDHEHEGVGDRREAAFVVDCRRVRIEADDHEAERAVETSERQQDRVAGAEQRLELGVSRRDIRDRNRPIRLECGRRQRKFVLRRYSRPNADVGWRSAVRGLVWRRTEQRPPAVSTAYWCSGGSRSAIVALRARTRARLASLTESITVGGSYHRAPWEISKSKWQIRMGLHRMMEGQAAGPAAPSNLVTGTGGLPAP
jgi:hypothetical protein